MYNSRQEAKIALIEVINEVIRNEEDKKILIQQVERDEIKSVLATLTRGNLINNYREIIEDVAYYYI